MSLARIIKAVSTIWLFAASAAFAAVIEPVTHFTARNIQSGDELVNVLVGGEGEGTPLKYSFLSIKEGTSDRVVVEYDVRSLANVQNARLEFGMTNMDPPNTEKILIHAFEGNGLANAADYFNIGNVIATVTDAGDEPCIVNDIRDPPPCAFDVPQYSVDVTDAVNAADQFLGLAFQAEGASARYRILEPPVLNVVVPEPLSSSWAMVLLVAMATRSTIALASSRSVAADG